MPKNDFLIFDENEDNLLSQSDYQADNDRLNGFRAGIARSNINNKVLHQVSTMSYALGELLNNRGFDASDEDAVTLYNNLSSALASGGGGGSGNEGIPPSVCTRLRKSQEGTTVTLHWEDPEDTIINEQVLCTWGSTVIVRKQGSYPTSIDDGDVIITSTTRNAFRYTPLVDELPDDTNVYCYKAFPVSLNGVACLDSKNNFTSIVYEFFIDDSNSDPDGAVIYAGNNEDYTPAYMDSSTLEMNYGSWKDAFFMDIFRPCMLNPEGDVKYYLDPNDYDLQEDGETPSEIADSTQSANAMVEIGQVWIKEVNLSNGWKHIFLASERVDEDYDCYTHINRDGTFRDVIYRAMYDGSRINNVIRSLSGQTICKTVSGETQIAEAKANGDGWSVDEYNLRRMINYLLILMGKSLDTQTVFGTGRYSGGSSSSNNQLDTGQLNQSGMFGSGGSDGAVKVFHIENWWGNIWKITLGILQRSGELYYKMCEGTLDGSNVDDYLVTDSEVTAGYTNYIDSGRSVSNNTDGSYIKTMALVPGLGLIPSSWGGSSTTYYCDEYWCNTSNYGFARFGGDPSHSWGVGAFAFSVTHVCSYSDWHYGVALSYKTPS